MEGFCNTVRDPTVREMLCDMVLEIHMQLCDMLDGVLEMHLPTHAPGIWHAPSHSHCDSAMPYL